MHLVFDNSYLLERDRTYFEGLWNLAGCIDKVEYHIGCAFEPEKNSLILVDESDRMMFEEPKAFLRFVNGTFCVCFTATPSNCDEHGVEAEVIKALGFKQYDYILDLAPMKAVERLRFDEINYAENLEKKVEVVKNFLD